MPKTHDLVYVSSQTDTPKLSFACLLTPSKLRDRNRDSLRVAMADADIDTLDPGLGSCSFGVTV